MWGEHLFCSLDFLFGFVTNFSLWRGGGMFVSVIRSDVIVVNKCFVIETLTLATCMFLSIHVEYFSCRYWAPKPSTKVIGWQWIPTSWLVASQTRATLTFLSFCSGGTSGETLPQKASITFLKKPYVREDCSFSCNTLSSLICSSGSKTGQNRCLQYIARFTVCDCKCLIVPGRTYTNYIFENPQIWFEA